VEIGMNRSKPKETGEPTSLMLTPGLFFLNTSFFFKRAHLIFFVKRALFFIGT
jgi:hypothetical protein